MLRAMGGPRWLAVGHRADGIVRLLNHGSDGHPRRDDPLYRRLSYSSATVPVHVNGIDDNTIQVGAHTAPSRHRGLLAGAVRREGAASRWRLEAQGRDAVVDLTTLVVGEAELRMARLSGVIGQRIRCTGWAVSADQPVATLAPSGWAGATGPDGLVSAVAWVGGATGSPESGPSSGVEAGPHRHALGDHVALPWLEAGAGTDGVVHLAWLVHLGRSWDPGLANLVTVHWLPDGAAVAIDGREHHCGWVRELPWRADEPNQGIFRVGSAAVGR